MNTNSPWPNAGACARGSTSTTGSIRGDQFDQTFVGGYAGPRWLFSRNTEMSLLATASQRWWGGQSSFNYDYGARLEVEHRVFAGLRLSGRALWSDRKYQQQKFLEGQLMVFSLGVSYVPFPIAQGSTPWSAISSRGRWRIAGTAPGTGRGWARTWRCRGALPWVPAPSSGGRITNPGGSRSWPITLRPVRTRPASCRPRCSNRAITVFGFSPQVAFSNQVRESNAQLWDFKRNLVELRWIRQF